MPTSDLYLYADRAQIEQVLINLLKNARETCERRTDKNIEIKFFSKGNPTFTISDNGEGILPDVLDKIFVPFFTTKTSSSGIGLSLCKQIMTLHDGSINVKSFNTMISLGSRGITYPLLPKLFVSGFNSLTASLTALLVGLRYASAC